MDVEQQKNSEITEVCNRTRDSFEPAFEFHNSEEMLRSEISMVDHVSQIANDVSKISNNGYEETNLKSDETDYKNDILAEQDDKSKSNIGDSNVSNKYTSDNFIELSKTDDSKVKDRQKIHNDEIIIRVPRNSDEGIPNTEDHPNIFLPSETLSKAVKKSKRRTPRVDEMDPDTVCGIGFFKPQWLQVLASPKAYLTLYSILGVLQGSYYSYLISILTTIEKRYAFKSKTSGVIMLADEITPLVLGVFVGYFGGKAHRPRVVAIGMFFSALCCIVSVLPYFIFGETQTLMSVTVRNTTISAFCDARGNEEICDEDERPPTMSAVGCFILGSFLKGLGNLAYYSIGIAFMDDSTKKKNTPLYFAITMSLRILGPTTGFVMASASLKYYENPSGDPGFGPKDPRWIGAWWSGFLLQGILLLVFSFPMLLFPKRLPKQRTKAFSNTANIAQETFQETLKGLAEALKRLAKNKVYVLFSLGSICAIISQYGYFVTSPKYVENQFRLTASQTSFISGPPSLVALMVSSTAGGIAIWKWRPNAKRLVGAIIVTEIFGVLGFLILMIPSCHNYAMAGTSQVNGQIQLMNNCNQNCGCSMASISPVCGPDGVSSYFSACHAGCSTMNIINDTEVYQNCSCIYDGASILPTVEKVNSGFCVDETCWTQMMIYLTIILVTTISTNSLRVGNKIVLLRCIEPEDKNVALGLFETSICAFGFLPYPLLYGAFVDSACLVWESSCGQTGNCWFYDVDRFKFLLHGTAAVFSALAAIFYIGVYLSAHQIKDIYIDDDEDALKKGPEL